MVASKKKPLYPDIRETASKGYTYLGVAGRTDVYVFRETKALLLQHSSKGGDWTALYTDKHPWIKAIPGMDWDAVAMRLLMEGYAR